MHPNIVKLYHKITPIINKVPKSLILDQSAQFYYSTLDFSLKSKTLKMFKFYFYKYLYPVKFILKFNGQEIGKYCYYDKILSLFRNFLAKINSFKNLIKNSLNILNFKLKN